MYLIHLFSNNPNCWVNYSLILIFKKIVGLMFTRTFLILLISNLSFAQSSDQLFDSIVKYKHQNPSLALEYGLEYKKLSLDRKIDMEIIQFYGAMGEILSNMGFDASALEYLRQAIKLNQAIPSDQRKFSEIDELPGVLLNIGNIYFRNKEYEKADELFTKAISLYQKISDENAKFFGINTAMSNRALIKQVQQDYSGAEKTLLKVYERRKEYGKVVDIIYSMNSLLTISLLKDEIIEAENILASAINIYNRELQKDNENPILKRNMGYGFSSFGSIMQYKKQFEKAIVFLNKSKSYLEDFPMDLASIGSRLAECHLALNHLDIAEEIALKNLETKKLNETEKLYNYRVLEKVYNKKKMNPKLIKIKDSLIIISSGLSTLKTIKSLKDLDTEIKLAKSARELNESKIKYNTYLYIFIICTVILFFSLVTIRVNYNYQKEKGNRLEIEKVLISNKLNQKNRELVSKTNFILQRNEYLKKIKSKLETSESSKENFERISFELNSVINSEKSYKDFDKMFVNVYPDFYEKLNEISELTSTDLRLASLIKMNHSNNEIAIISGVSLRTIESQRYRLAKKLKLEKNQSLNTFLLSV